MNLSISQLIQITEPLSTTVSSPKLDLIQLAWDHITQRYLQRIGSNRIFAGRVRAIRLLAVHDAIHSVIDPGNGNIYKEISEGSTIEAAYAAAVKSSHDVLAAVFTDSEDREDLADLLDESLSLIGKEDEKAAGIFSGSDSASAYLRNFAPLLVNHQPPGKKVPSRPRRELATASGGSGFW
ncbi:MAG: hypothetical protein V4689_00810 [Verrucomicrobiota bacterium]